MTNLYSMDAVCSLTLKSAWVDKERRENALFFYDCNGISVVCLSFRVQFCRFIEETISTVNIKETSCLLIVCYGMA